MGIMKNLLVATLLVGALFALPAVAIGQEIRAKAGDTIEAVVRGKSDKVTAKGGPEAVLVFLREVEGRLQPVGGDGVAYGEAFVIELRFGQAQEESQLTVDLEWEEGQQQIDMLRAGESRTLYRSDTLQLDYQNGAARLVQEGVQP
jgi:hypothetical protein